MTLLAYSYLRFSSPGQADGDSIRRQTAAAKAWCQRNGVELDTSRSYQDHGRSAFRGMHREQGVLGQFLAEVEAGHIPRGSFLILENLDRLSRENPWKSLPLLCSLVEAGVVVITLAPTEMRYAAGSDMTLLILAIIEFSRGHSESAVKSNRMGSVWGEKKKAARTDGTIMTKNLPGWIEERNGKLVLNAERAKPVRRIFKLAIAGYGIRLIIKNLVAAGIPSFGRTPLWNKPYIYLILRGKAVLGVHQPLKEGEPDGPPMTGYYPAAIGEKTWNQAQAALASRFRKGGPVGEMVANLFSGLLFDARTQERMVVLSKHNAGHKRRLITPAGASNARTPGISFPYPVFEGAVLSLLREIKPSDITGEEPEAESVVLGSSLVAVEKRMAAIEAELTGESSGVAALARVLKKLASKQKDLGTQLANARQREAKPTSSAWTEAKSLLDIAKNEGQRLRLRGLLRQIVDNIQILVVPRRSHRLAVVQINFVGGTWRDYLIHCWSACHHRQGGWTVKSMAIELPSAGLGRDLRDGEHMRLVEQMLTDMDLRIMREEDAIDEMVVAS